MNVESFKLKVKISVAGLVLAMLIASAIFAPLSAATPAEAAAPATSALSWVVIAAALAFGLGALGAGIAIANVGAAAMGAISEKPELASQALIFIALAEGLVVFGFITALLILGKA